MNEIKYWFGLINFQQNKFKEKKMETRNGFELKVKSITFTFLTHVASSECEKKYIDRNSERK